MELLYRSIRKISNDGLLEFLRAARFKLLKDSYRHSFRLSPNLAPSFVRAYTTLHPRFLDNPFELRYVDPCRITHISRLRPNRLYGVIHGGEWDKDCPDLYSYPIHSSLRRYLVHGETEPLLDLFVNHVNDPIARPWGHESVETFEERLAEIDELYDSIRRHGYLSQRELLARDSEETRLSNNEPVPIELNEITVDIGRNGEVLYNMFGSHRLTIAQHLELEEVPVIVAARHAEYSDDGQLPHVRSDGFAPKSP